MLLMSGIAALTLALDIAAKLWATAELQFDLVRLGWVLELRLTHNDGMALGIFSGNRLAGLLLPLAVIACGWLLLRRYKPTAFTRVACGLVLGGFAGNYGERLINGYVTDMIHFPFMPWFVCNVADIAICAGVAMLAISLLLRPQDWREDDAKCKG